MQISPLAGGDSTSDRTHTRCSYMQPLSEVDKQKVVEAIADYVQSIKANPSLSICSMCEGRGTLLFDEAINCPRCEGSGTCGSFAIVLEESEGD